MSASSEPDPHPSSTRLGYRLSLFRSLCDGIAAPVILPASTLVVTLFVRFGQHYRRFRSTNWGGLTPG